MKQDEEERLSTGVDTVIPATSTGVVEDIDSLHCKPCKRTVGNCEEEEGCVRTKRLRVEEGIVILFVENKACWVLFPSLLERN